MKIAIVDYPKINPSYQLNQPIWLKAIMLTGALSMLILAFYLIGTNIVIMIVVVLVISVMGLGVYNQLKNGSISPLLANREFIFIIASQGGKEFLRIPWGYVKCIDSGMHGLNKRGIIISMNARVIAQDELGLVAGCLNIVDSKPSEVTISVPTGVVKRETEIERLINSRNN